MKFNFEFNHNINYKIKGLNIEKSLNNLTKNKIKLKNIKKNEQNEVEFSSFYKNNSKLLNYLEKKNIKILNKQDYGMVFSLKKLLKRYALIASVFFSFIVIFFSQNFILKIEVFGNKDLSTSEIQSCIKNLGVCAFTFKNSFSTTDLENKILKELPR